MDITTLTDLEVRTLRTIPKECFYENGFGSLLWTDCFMDTLERIESIPAKVARGVLSSLEQKEYIDMETGKDGVIWLLEKGKAWLMEQGMVDENGRKVDPPEVVLDPDSMEAQLVAKGLTKTQVEQVMVAAMCGPGPNNVKINPTPTSDPCVPSKKRKAAPVDDEEEEVIYSQAPSPEQRKMDGLVKAICKHLNQSQVEYLINLLCGSDPNAVCALTDTINQTYEWKPEAVDSAQTMTVSELLAPMCWSQRVDISTEGGEILASELPLDEADKQYGDRSVYNYQAVSRAKIAIRIQ